MRRKNLNGWEIQQMLGYKIQSVVINESSLVFYLFIFNFAVHKICCSVIWLNSAMGGGSFYSQNSVYDYSLTFMSSLMPKTDFFFNEWEIEM